MNQKQHYTAIRLDADLIVPDYDDYKDENQRRGNNLSDMFTDEITTEFLDIALTILKSHEGCTLRRTEKIISKKLFGLMDTSAQSLTHESKTIELWVVSAPESCYFHVLHSCTLLPWKLNPLTKPFMLDFADSKHDLVLMHESEFFRHDDQILNPKLTHTEILNFFTSISGGEQGVLCRPTRTPIQINQALKSIDQRLIKITSQFSVITENDSPNSWNVILVNSEDATHYYEARSAWEHAGIIDTYIYQDNQ